MIVDRPRIAVATAGACAFLNLYSPQAVLPQLSDSFGVSAAAAGGVVGVATLAVAGSAPFVGLLSDFLSRKLTAVLAMCLLAAPTLMLAHSHSLNEILFWRFAQGLLVPAVFTPTVALVGERWSPREAADVMGLYVAGSALGGFLGRFLPAILADSLGWRSGLVALAPITLAAAAVVAAWLPSGAAKTSAPVERPRLADAFAHLRDPAIIATCFAGFAVLFSIVAVFTYINFRLAPAPYGFTASDLGLIFLVYPIGALAAPAAGPLARRLGRRRTMAAATLVAGLGLVATLQTGLPAIVAGLALFVIGIFVMQSTAMGFVGRAARRAKASALGLYVCVYYLGGAVGAILPGLLVWDRAGWTGCVALVAAALSAAGALSWWAWWDEPAEDAAGVAALVPAE
jgi:predicted MFS family arabinose efflux permease